MRQPKASYDPSADALYIKFSEDAIADSEMILPHTYMIFYYAEDSRLVGIEIITVSHLSIRDWIGCLAYLGRVYLRSQFQKT
jgi:uncharacterized protein YuzE